MYKSIYLSNLCLCLYQISQCGGGDRAARGDVGGRVPRHRFGPAAQDRGPGRRRESLRACKPYICIELLHRIYLVLLTFLTIYLCLVGGPPGARRPGAQGGAHSGEGRGGRARRL